jgi:type VI protein secretion system component VasF
MVGVAVGRHHLTRRPVWLALLLAVVLVVLLALCGWAVLEARADCLAGRIPGPWC